MLLQLSGSISLKFRRKELENWVLTSKRKNGLCTIAKTVLTVGDFCPRQDKGRPLPKFGEWDVNNPATAEGYTVIFSKARDEKKTNAAGNGTASQQNASRPRENYQIPPSV